MSTASLFTPLVSGKLSLKHRVSLSALTRLRMSHGAETPREMNAVYYEQRASDGGLLVSECMAISQGGRGYVRAPGIYKEGQAEAWKPIVERVHNKGSTFYAQIFHAGRVSHSNLVGGKLPVAPSAVGMAGQLYVEGGVKKDYEVPRALETAEIPGIVEEFASAAKAAISAGFDGVEIHAGNGYLLQEFLALKTNVRTDQYGGPVENRARLLLEVLDACSAEIGADRLAVKLQPGVTFSDLIEPEEDVGVQIDYLAKPLAARKLAYVDLSSLNSMPYCQVVGLPGPNISFDPFRRFRQAGYDGTLMINGALTGETAAAYVADGTADLASFGAPFISNANLPALLKAGKELNQGFWNAATWYSKNPADDEKGYIDWPLVEA